MNGLFNNLGTLFFISAEARAWPRLLRHQQQGTRTVRFPGRNRAPVTPARGCPQAAHRPRRRPVPWQRSPAVCRRPCRCLHPEMPLPFFIFARFLSNGLANRLQRMLIDRLRDLLHHMYRGRGRRTQAMGRFCECLLQAMFRLRCQMLDAVK